MSHRHPTPLESATLNLDMMRRTRGALQNEIMRANDVKKLVPQTALDLWDYLTEQVERAEQAHRSAYADVERAQCAAAGLTYQESRT